MIFTRLQMTQLRKGEGVSRTFPVLTGNNGYVEACPFKAGQCYSAKRDGAKRSSFKVLAAKVTRDIDWTVLFVKVAEIEPVRLLAQNSALGYVDDPSRAMNREADPGEAVPPGYQAKITAEVQEANTALREAKLAKVRAAVEELAADPDPRVQRHVRMFTRQIEQASQDLAA